MKPISKSRPTLESAEIFSVKGAGNAWVHDFEGEELLKYAAKTTGLGYGIWDEVRGAYIMVSDGFARPYGLTPDEYLDHYNTHLKEDELIHAEDRVRYDAHYMAYLMNPTEVQIEYRVDAPGVEIVHIREFMKPVFDTEGRLTHSIVIEQDITDLKEAEEQLRHAQKMEALGHLTGGMAHDFNNLLAVIVGNLELVNQMLDTDSESAELLEMALEAADHGASLTQRLLAFSRKQELRPEPVDIDALIWGMSDLLRSTLGGTIELEVNRCDGAWLSQIDRGQLESAMLNLAINARDAMKTGGRLAVEISNVSIDDSSSASNTLSPGDYVHLSVSDTGCGMPKRIVERVFEPFFTTKEVGEGSGLGLSMVYGFVRQSGGYINVDSVEGRSTSVDIFLPRDPAATEEAHRESESGSLPRGCGEIVLVVEDDFLVRCMTVRMLQSLGYVVRQAGDAETAREMIRSEARIDLLACDVVLPGGTSGRELAEEVKSRYPELPVLLISGFTQRSDGDADLAANAEFLHKPFRLEGLSRSVRRLLDRKSY